MWDRTEEIFSQHTRGEIYLTSKDLKTMRPRGRALGSETRLSSSHSRSPISRGPALPREPRSSGKDTPVSVRSGRTSRPEAPSHVGGGTVYTGNSVFQRREPRLGRGVCHVGRRGWTTPRSVDRTGGL